MTLRLLRNLILVRTVANPALSTSGLVLLDSYDDGQMIHRVLQLGPKAPPEIQVGDYIVTTPYGQGLRFQLPNLTKIYDPCEVLAIIPNPYKPD